MLNRQSSDPSWAETVRRVSVPYYEEARPWFDEAASDGWETQHKDKLSCEKLIAIIQAFTR